MGNTLFKRWRQKESDSLSQAFNDINDNKKIKSLCTISSFGNKFLKNNCSYILKPKKKINQSIKKNSSHMFPKNKLNKNN